MGIRKYLKYPDIKIINNIDATIVCEKPKIIDYSKEMKKNIANILNINEKKISIKGKTSESIGSSILEIFPHKTQGSNFFS